MVVVADYECPKCGAREPKPMHDVLGCIPGLILGVDFRERRR